MVLTVVTESRLEIASPQEAQQPKVTKRFQILPLNSSHFSIVHPCVLLCAVLPCTSKLTLCSEHYLFDTGYSTSFVVFYSVFYTELQLSFGVVTIFYFKSISERNFQNMLVLKALCNV